MIIAEYGLALMLYDTRSSFEYPNKDEDEEEDEDVDRDYERRKFLFEFIKAWCLHTHKKQATCQLLLQCQQFSKFGKHHWRLSEVSTMVIKIKDVI